MTEPGSHRDRKRMIRRAMGVIAGVFLVKSVVLAFWVTPLWDVPDESGHYGIVADLAQGRGLPVPGATTLPADVLADWSKGKTAGPYLNWVAQHPPLYHLLAAPILSAAKAVTADPQWLYRAPRLLSAISGAAALLVFFAAFLEATADPMLSFAAAAGVGFVPMYSHLSSGTNHDILLALASGLAALGFARLARSGSFADAMTMAAGLALAGGVKLSAVVPAAALTLLAAFRLRARGSRRLAQAAVIGMTSVSLALAWTLRHWLLFGNARVHPVSKEPFRLSSFLDYLRAEPVLDHTFKNFFGLIGWMGTGGGEVRWFQVSGVFLAPYLLLALSCAAGAAFWFWRQGGSRRTARAICGASAASVFLLCLTFFSGAGAPGLLKGIVYSVLAAVPFVALPRAFGRGSAAEKVLAGSQLVFLVFCAAYLVNSFEAYEIYGQMRATNGRYFFAVLPFLVLAFPIAAARNFAAGRRRDAVLLTILVALFLNETAFFLLRVVPFYRDGS
jgi:hypothetical protein